MNRSLYLIVALAVVLSACAPRERATTLFDGKTFTGWKVSEHPNSATIQDGTITCSGDRAHVFFVGEGGEEANYKNFDFSAEVKTRPGTNSGIFFHTKYQEADWPQQGFEVQVNNSQQEHDGYYEFKKTGSLYGVRNTYKAWAPDNEWFTMRIRVVGNHVQTWVGDRKVVDYVEPANAEKKLSSGTFALQCHDPESFAQYRNIKVTRLPDDLTDDVKPPVRDSVYDRIVQLSHDNFPLTDYHVHLKGGLTADQAVLNAQRDGIMYGIAPNVGLNFWIKDDKGIQAFIDSMKTYPVYLGMQAEGREWVNLVSREAVAKFDYVFSDAMTFTDDRTGKRSRIWLKDEHEVGDPQQFMDMYVNKIVGVITNEPIDIHVNPTFLPESIQNRYDELWTTARMDRVIKALKDNDVALEINSRYRIPSMTFLHRAKDAGVKFTCGTNNVGAEVGRSEYCLEAIRELKLTNKDFFMPNKEHMRVNRMPNALRAAAK